jgi:hypothetical protein
MVSVRIKGSFFGIKGKLTQIRLNEEVIVEQSVVQRSQTTGELMIKMKKMEEN